MALDLPNLDDRTWDDLVQEARALIPFYAPQWTNQNPSDPGITLIELLASVAEADLYFQNRVADASRRKFLELLGQKIEPAHPAHTVVTFTSPAGAAPAALPAGLELQGTDSSGNLVAFRSLQNLVVVDVALRAVLVQESAANQPVDRTARFMRGEIILPFGPDPRPGCALYVSFDKTPAAGTPFTIHFQLQGPQTDWQERHRIETQIQAARDACRPVWRQKPCYDCAGVPIGTTGASADAPLVHHSARTVWEILTAGGWTSLHAAEQVIDETRNFTLSGSVTFVVPPVSPPGLQLRCRFTSGAFDAAPVISRISLNAVALAQSVPSAASFDIAVGAQVTGVPPAAAADPVPVRFDLNNAGAITSLDFSAPQGDSSNSPLLRVLQFVAPTAVAAGKIVLEVFHPGVGNGRPNQQFQLPSAVVLTGTQPARIFALESGQWFQWTLRPDFDSSSADSRHITIDEVNGVLTAGDGQNGRAMPRGALILIDGLFTIGAAGNLALDAAFGLRDSAHNRSIPAWPAIVTAGLTIAAPYPSVGGMDGQTVQFAAGTTEAAREAVQRAVTLSDYETLARQTPGARIARVSAFVNTHPAFPCSRTPGVVTVVVLPFLPLGRPAPSDGLLRAVGRYLMPRRIVGSTVVVVGPVYKTVTVQVTVSAQKGVIPADLQSRVSAAINSFFDPLSGGPDGTGWPLGRDVYQTDVLNVIARVPGVEHVDSLMLVADCQPPSCGNICIGALGLVSPGDHQIQVQPTAGVTTCPPPRGRSKVMVRK